MLALVGVPLDFPIVTYDNQGTVSYDSVSQIFALDATPLSFLASASSIPPFPFVTAPKDLLINIQVDDAGALVGGVPGNDFFLKGEIDLDGDNMVDVSGTLLTGEVSQFGFFNFVPGSTDLYDFRFTTTGGALTTSGSLSGGGSYPAYFAGKDITVFTTSEQSSFHGSFAADFAGGAKGNIGSADPLDVEPEVDLEKYTRVDVNPIDIQKLVRVESPPVSGDVCDVLGKPVALTFQYLPGTMVHTAQDSAKAKVLFDGGVDDDGVSFVVVSDQNDAAKALNGEGKTFFSSEVAFEEYFEANENTADFGSSTYIHFFDDAAGGLLQTVTYHTSCSQPIQLGDVVGNATLAGYQGESGEAEVVDLGPGVNDDDADGPTGPEAQPGDTVVFTYVVTNPISGTEISIVQVTDEVLAPISEPSFSPDPVLDGGFNIGDADMDNKLDYGEEWLYTSSTPITTETAVGQYVDKATVEGTVVGSDGAVFDLDPAHFTVPAVPPVQGDVCDVLGKPVALTFEYDPGTTVATGQDSSKAKILFQGDVDDDEVSYIVVSDRSNASEALAGGGKTFFHGNVAFNATFEANEDIDSFGSTTFIHFFDNAAGGLLQSITYHTSCSQPIQLGDVVGNATLVAYEGESGSAAVPPPPVAPQPVDLGSGILFSTDDPFSPGYIGENADSPTGPIAQIGDKVTYTYRVSNPGSVALTIEDLVDDNATPGDPGDDFSPTPVLVGGFNFGDVNTDNLLDPGEDWYFQAMQIATDPGQHTNMAEVSVEDVISGNTAQDNDASNHIVNPLAIEKYVFVPTALGDGIDLCDDHGKPQELTFQYTGGGEDATYTAQPEDKFDVIDVVPGGPNDALTVFIRSTDKSSASDLGGKIFFTGVVDLDAEFSISGDFGSSTFLHIFDATGTDLLQTVRYHTSCSAPIVLGDIVGGVTLTGFLGESGQQIDLNPNGALGDPADTPTGPVVFQGEHVVFNFEVTNLGNVDLTNVQVTDSQLGPVTDFVDMGDGDGLLEPGETWILTISYIANDPGQQMNLGTVTANSVEDPTGDLLSQSDPAHHFVESVKFFVPDKDDDATYRYTESGQAIDSVGLNGDNSDARGAAALADGSRLWVLDKDPNKNVYVYSGEGNQFGAWQARKTFAEGSGSLPDKVEGIATDGTDIWIVEKDKHQVYYYSGGASFVSGSHDATSKFELHSDNDHARGITTDGDHIWVVDEDHHHGRVYKYSVSGTYLGSWNIDPENEKPRGITIDPSGGSSIWIVDQDTDQIFQYDAATGLTNGSRTADAVFDLDPENDKPEGIADPPPRDASARRISRTSFEPVKTGSWTQGDFLSAISNPARVQRQISGAEVFSKLTISQSDWSASYAFDAELPRRLRVALAGESRFSDQSFKPSVESDPQRATFPADRSTELIDGFMADYDEFQDIESWIRNTPDESPQSDFAEILSDFAS